MESNRFVKILWTVNGVLLFFCFVFILVVVVREIIKNGSSYEEPEIIVGEELAKAKKEGLILQGLTYGEPTKIHGYPYYLLTVSIQTFNNPKQAERAFDFDKRNKLRVGRHDSRVVNVIFLNMDFEPVKVILNKKGFIHAVEYSIESYSNNARTPADSLRTGITYLISSDDSNQDGIINDQDDADLYYSNCDGSLFTQVTQNWNVKSHSFVSKKDILIRYTLRNKEEEEHKKMYFAIYNTQNKSVKELSRLHTALDEIEAQLTQ